MVCGQGQGIFLRPTPAFGVRAPPAAHPLPRKVHAMVLRSLRELFRRPAVSQKSNSSRRQPRPPSRVLLGCETLEERMLLSGQPLPFAGVDPDGNVAYVRRLYQEILNRDPDG